ncbi:lipoyl(octanoyl) transferase LipB [Legionella gresilensis]|uniref:lipoyl(octanoyl) transferase LipB n=1 Tax=Legionella gresilensis TaxID=91823 RepID=UPI0010415EDE|nr:lipoyl(octanoyl) transferase LipB [Legionella gresilensis]
MLIIRHLGLQDYLSTWEKMKQFTLDRVPTTADECWLLEHPAVYTQGQAGKAEHIINPGNIPVIQSDRGGQVTYHGPGQIVAYLLMDLKRQGLSIRALVNQLEQILISLLAQYAILAVTKEKAPGVYVDGRKIASLGLRVKNGCTYHGIALNVNMDLTPFAGINPCGFDKLQMTQICDYVRDINFADVNNQLAELLSRSFN